jgi:hypothetical protein
MGCNLEMVDNRESAPKLVPGNFRHVESMGLCLTAPPRITLGPRRHISPMVFITTQDIGARGWHGTCVGVVQKVGRNCVSIVSIVNNVCDEAY